MSKTIYIFANGELRDPDRIKKMILPGDILIAADGGGNHLWKLGMTPQFIIGDLDSIFPEVLNKYRLSGSEVKQFSKDKNETDLELAVNLAVDLKISKIVIVAGLGGRLDQTLANLSLLLQPQLVSLDIHLEDGLEEAWFLKDSGEIIGDPGDTVSLIPWGMTVTGVQTFGLKYPLIGETLYSDKTRGISNQMSGSLAKVKKRSGRMLCIHTRKKMED